MEEKIKKINTKILDLVLNTDFTKLEDHGLFTGKLGVVLYLLSLYKRDQAPILKEKIQILIEQIFSDLSSNKSQLLHDIGLYDGLTGLGYLLFCLKQDNFIDSEIDNQINIINELVIDQAYQMLDEGAFDFFYGPIGILHYFDYIKNDKLCEAIIHQLYQIGQQNNFIYYNITHDPYSEGLNFGFAHGSAALVAVLLNIYQRGVCVDYTKEIIIGILDNMLLFRKDNIDLTKSILVDTLPTSYKTEFPYNVVADDSIIDLQYIRNNQHNKLHYSGRLGWCNGDLSMLFILFKAAIVVKKDIYKEIANQLIHRTVLRLHENDTKVKDSFICHGSAGIAMLYRKLFQLTGENKFNEANKLWIEKTIDLLEKEYSQYSSIPEIIQLLTGFCGSSLVLESHLTNTSFSEFENLFLCMTPYE
ncbi:lanthionine synthetase LanC family protein [Myroides odoratus]|uniref:Lanthionine synthetase n=1 Tax=Myroides odoratus TaxID=256 RepID=A0A9Q7E7P9_MYROD|nr:lanthionine synthetase LanC family protein [Myroides odoratus]EHQ41398.1 Lanthionine synthetase C family protein [Myroides odoratus DSM 2801]EKB08731.1 hypothetical protein HMPREF9716_00782 [Myroides odoratus CIP 103059]QQT98832.1 lanthionine synthetase [Myroides odoratus]WQD58984.1 lanthionine synthetase LanC family protein [Myroides odoratus]STZ32437.1 Lantibiotic modifying enzyme [Myroides odoratus]